MTTSHAHTNHIPRSHEKAGNVGPPRMKKPAKLATSAAGGRIQNGPKIPAKPMYSPPGTMSHSQIPLAQHFHRKNTSGSRIDPSSQSHTYSSDMPNPLLLLCSAALPPGVFEPADLCRRRRWRQVQYLADLFWSRWTKEYLPQLRQATKWLTPQRDIAIGDVVLLLESPLPRNEWQLGRIGEVYPGRDGRMRTAKATAGGKEVVRPITKLSLLEEVLDVRGPTAANTAVATLTRTTVG